MNKDITIIVADDHPILLKGLAAELTEAGYTVVSSEPNGGRALEQILIEKPVLAILDVEMPILSGFEVIQKCLEKKSKTKFIILTSHKEKGIVFKAKELGVSGYLLKDESFQEIVKCIHAVVDGNTYFSSTFESILENEVSPQLSNMRNLSNSEKTILKFLASEKTSKEIGDILGVSHRTVEKHRSNIIAKLDIESQGLLLWINENKDLISSLL